MTFFVAQVIGQKFSAVVVRRNSVRFSTQCNIVTF